MDKICFYLYSSNTYYLDISILLGALIGISSRLSCSPPASES